MDQALIALYHRNVAAAFDRQMRLFDFLHRESGDLPWNYRISTATLTFGDTVRFEAFDLGSHATPDNSWLWAWCNPHLNLTAGNRDLAEAVRQLGRDAGIAAFTSDRQVSCDELLGPDVSPVTTYAIAAVVTGELQIDAYYTMPFANGRTVAVIRDNRLRVDEPNPVTRILTMFPRVLTDFPVLDHRQAFVAYAGWYGLTIEETPQTVRVFAGKKEAMKAKFDRRKRLTELKATIGPGPVSGPDPHLSEKGLLRGHPGV
jgi:hypothetical protein